MAGSERWSKGVVRPGRNQSGAAAPGRNQREIASLHAITVVVLGLLVLALGCSREPGSLRIGVAFETLQTEYWVASFEAVRAELDRRGIEMIEAVADNDANRQLEQIHTFIARGVDGILVAPKDATTVIPMIRAANEAGIPIVIYNRPPAKNRFQSTTVVADNYELAKATVRYMAEQAKRAGGRHQALVLIGDLADINAVGRRDGFEDAVAEFAETIDVVARVPTEWSQDKALDGVRNALYAHPDIDFVFTSSDFLFPSLVAALKDAGKYHKVGQSGHVLLGGFDGDSTAYRMLADGYLDACGVQDVYYECSASIDALLRMHRGEAVEPILRDPGFVIHQGNLHAKAPQMWGAAADARRGSPTPPEPPTAGLPQPRRPAVGPVARSETGHSAR